MTGLLRADVRKRIVSVSQQWSRDAELGVNNLMLHGLRSLLTMLGMIFGVAAVVAMLSIGAGARQKVMALIEQMGVRNLIVEAKETIEWQAHEKVRKISPGLTLQDYRVIQADVADVVASTPRKKLTPTKMIPKPQQDMPVVFGVNASYRELTGLQVINGRFFDEKDNDAATPVCVLGSSAKWSLFGASNAIGEYVKANEQWFRVIGEVSPQLSSDTPVAGTGAVDMNNNIYIPLKSAFLRMEDSYSDVRDEVDGIYLEFRDPDQVTPASQIVRAILDSSHHGADDFTIVVPAELLAEQKRTERLFNTVMVAIASISLLVGGIGIMNIMLASILERTREIGLRRSLGARRSDIIRQFVIEATVISFAGGMIGVVLGFVISRSIAWLAGWSTVVTFSSIALAFLVSISVGLVFGIYPATKAARLDPVEALRYE
jgi:putative ABC transport system permease protein